MDADADHGCHERIMLLCVYEHTVQAVIIEYAVVDTFRGGALTINLLISICATRNIGVKPDIPFGPSLDDLPIFGAGAGVFTFETVIFPIGAAPHEVTAGFVITIRLHTQFFLTQRPSLSMVMISGIAFGRPHLSFRSMKARIPMYLRIR